MAPVCAAGLGQHLDHGGHVVDVELIWLSLLTANLSFWEKLYLPAILGGLKVTTKHAWGSLFQGKQVTMQYPEQKWTVPDGYRGAPYLVKDQDNKTKCVSCQLCEFVCPPKAIRITPPGDSGLKADRPGD